MTGQDVLLCGSRLKKQRVYACVCKKENGLFFCHYFNFTASFNGGDCYSYVADTSQGEPLPVKIASEQGCREGKGQSSGR